MPDDPSPLLDRLRDGDRSALAEFIEGNRGKLMGYIERQLRAGLRRKVDPDDIYQELCADAVRSLPKVQLAGRDPLPWLYELAERRIVDAHRHYFDAQKRDARREVPLAAPDSGTRQAGLINMLVNSMTTPSQAFSRDARELRLLGALGQLPEDQREAIRLRYVENLPSKEIAKRLEKSDAAVRVMLTRSLKRLQAILETEASDGERGAPAP